MSNPYEIAAEHGADLNGCHSEQGLTICTGTRGVHRRIVHNCPTCKRRTPFVETFRGVWYGHIFYCVNCLDGWIDGERMERPFYRYWKRDRAKRIRGLWDSAMMPRLYEAMVEFKIHEAFCDEAFAKPLTCATCIRVRAEVEAAS